MVSNTDQGSVRPTLIDREMRTAYMEYAMSVIVARALPDVRDGLKPVQRRILYAMQDLGMRPNTAYKKSARLVGEVLGKYHPHGDSAVYDAMVRMAQPFSMRMPLVDGQGNFGSVDDDPPAAMRYTEARLARIAEEMLANLDEETVDWIDNFDGTLKEPVVLPARLPNMLVNGASGIAVGMATNIPPHNPTEVCNAIIRLIEEPAETVESLVRIVKGPDFPTGGTIMGREGIRNAASTGRGQIIVRAKTDIEETKRSDRKRIVVTELPFQVNKATLVEKVAALVKSKRVEGISEIRDESNREGMRVVLELRGGAQPLVILNNLYKFTALQSSFSVNMLALVDGSPKVVNLKQALQHFIDFRREVVTRRTQYRLRKARERAHILAGLRIALANIDDVIEVIRSSTDVGGARSDLMARFMLDEIQANAILEMQLRRLASLERKRIEDEYQTLRETISGLEALLADPAKIMAEIKEEMTELKKSLRQSRRTEITAEAHELTREELEAHEQVVVTLSRGGYIKRIAASTFRNQHRGGKGVTGMNTKDDDPVDHILVVDTHDALLFFTNKGRVIKITAYELRPDLSRNTRGVPIETVMPLGPGEKVKAVIGVAGLDDEEAYLVLATRGGVIKRMALNAISNIRPSGLIIMNVKEGDELVAARLTKDDDDVIIVSEQGMSIRFPVTQVGRREEDGTIRPHSRTAGGVKGMDLRRDGRPNDRVVSMDVGRPETRLLVISELGYGKLTLLDKYRTQNRGGKGLMTFRITKKTGKVAAAQLVEDDKEVYVVSEQAQVIRTNLEEIRSIGRVTQGVSIFKPAPGDKVTSIACVSDLRAARQEASQTPQTRSNNGRRNGKNGSD